MSKIMKLQGYVAFDLRMYIKTLVYSFHQFNCLLKKYLSALEQHRTSYVHTGNRIKDF